MRPVGQLNAAELWSAEVQDVGRCSAEPWPFTWTPPGPRPGTEAEEDRRHDVRMAVVAQESAYQRAQDDAWQGTWLDRMRTGGWLT